MAMTVVGVVAMVVHGIVDVMKTRAWDLTGQCIDMCVNSLLRAYFLVGDDWSYGEV